MALIKCPECGRENVSDSAISCPGCGYAIKNHFENAHLEQQKKESVDTKFVCAICGYTHNDDSIPEKCPICKVPTGKTADKENKTETFNKSVDSSKDRQKKTVGDLNKQIESSKKVTWISAIIFCVCIIPLVSFFSDFDVNGTILFFSIIGSLFSGIAILIGLSNFTNASNDLPIAQRSIEEYEKVLQKRKEEKEAYDAMVAQNTKCPVCGSNETKRISTLSRATSVATVGLASSKIGKQYHCKRCGHKW